MLLTPSNERRARMPLPHYPPSPSTLDSDSVAFHGGLGGRSPGAGNEVLPVSRWRGVSGCRCKAWKIGVDSVAKKK